MLLDLSTLDILAGESLCKSSLHTEGCLTASLLSSPWKPVASPVHTTLLRQAKCLQMLPNGL